MTIPICDEDDINLLNSLEMKLLKGQGVSSRKAIGIITAFLPLIFLVNTYSLCLYYLELYLYYLDLLKYIKNLLNF